MAKTKIEQISNITEEEKLKAEEQINQGKVPVNYDTREYPVEVLIEKLENGEFVIPHYQRNFVWEADKEKMSRFIESIILDLPIPYLFFADENKSGKLEVVDGSQRLRTLQLFKNDGFKLEGLEVLDLLNGFQFTDLIESRKRRFLRKTLRSIELTEMATAGVKQDLFSRINTKPYDLTPMEIRKGLYPGDFYDFIVSCSNDAIFNKICPISRKTGNRLEAQELILRYFAFSDNYKNFKQSLFNFLDDYIKDKHKNGFDKNGLTKQFQLMVEFVDKFIPNGFRKSEKSNSVARVRFDSIAVGVTLALREKPNLKPKPSDIENWLNSEDYIFYTTSGSANNRIKVLDRIEYVKNKLLEK